MKFLKNEKVKTILLVLGFYIIAFLVSYFGIANNDTIWNYGFSYNVANGLKMYKDFNMVITPLYPTIFGIILKLLGTNMLVFYLFNTLIVTFIFYIVYKNYKNAALEISLLLLLLCGPNYLHFLLLP